MQPGAEREGRMRLTGEPGMAVSSRLGGMDRLAGDNTEKKQQGKNEAPVAPTLQAGWARSSQQRGWGL